MLQNIIKKMITPTYLLIWLVLSLYMGYNHEPFSDEAQSFLIAKNASISEIFSVISRTEGTPALWYLWLKLCIFIGISYEYLSVTSIIPMFLGVALWIHKSPFPKVVTYLFPLSYFIFYQYNIVARNYSLLFLFMMLTSICYPKRQEKPFLYVLSLMFTASITAYSFIFSCGMFCIYILEQIKQKQSIIPQIVLYGIFTLLTIISLFPEIDNRYLADNIRARQVILHNLAYVSHQGFVAGYLHNEYYILLVLAGLLYFGYILYYLFREYPLQSLLLFLPTLSVMIIVPYHPWHSGILILIIMMIIMLHPSRGKINPKYMKIALILFFINQLCASSYLFIKDSQEAYSGGKQLARCIKEKGLDLDAICMPTYNSICVIPYFPKTSQSYWDWRKDGFVRKDVIRELSKCEAFVITEELYVSRKENFDKLQQEQGYKMDKFFGGTFFPYVNAHQQETQYFYYRSADNEK